MTFSLWGAALTPTPKPNAPPTMDRVRTTEVASDWEITCGACLDTTVASVVVSDFSSICPDQTAYTLRVRPVDHIRLLNSA
jgi:hypothetical protein